jgi:perosamine synthetase
LAKRYREAFSGCSGVSIFQDAPFAASNHWLIALLLDRPNLELRDDILGALNDAGIGARPAWTPMHRLPMYRDHPRASLPITESLVARIINLPSSQHLA